MKTSLNNPFSGGLAGFNQAARLAQDNKLGSSINNLSQINARRGVQDLMNQGTAMTDPAMQSLAMGMSQPQQQALQQRSDADALLNQRGIANTLAQDTFDYGKQNDQALAMAKLTEANTGRDFTTGERIAGEAYDTGVDKLANTNAVKAANVLNKRNITNNEQLQNYKAHNIGLKHDNALEIENKRGINNLVTATAKARAAANAKDLTPKQGIVSQAGQKAAGELFGKQLQKPAEQVAQEGADVRSDEKWWNSDNFSNDQQKTMKGWQDSFVADPYSAVKTWSKEEQAKFDAMPQEMQKQKLDEVKGKFAIMNGKQKQDFLAKIQGQNIRQANPVFRAFPNIFGISDYVIEDNRN